MSPTRTRRELLKGLEDAGRIDGWRVSMIRHLSALSESPSIIGILSGVAAGSELEEKPRCLRAADHDCVAYIPAVAPTKIEEMRKI